MGAEMPVFGLKRGNLRFYAAASPSFPSDDSALAAASLAALAA